MIAYYIIEILYCIIAFIWFIFLTKHLYLQKDEIIKTSYNSKLALMLCILISVTWILSIPIYILPIERKDIK